MTQIESQCLFALFQLRGQRFENGKKICRENVRWMRVREKKEMQVTFLLASFEKIVVVVVNEREIQTSELSIDLIEEKRGGIIELNRTVERSETKPERLERIPFVKNLFDVLENLLPFGNLV